MKQKAYLILENGTIFEGTSFGAQHTTIGEAVFTTGMSGYLETLTDKSYYGQLIISTFPLIGNYGTIHEDLESSSIYAGGYIVRHWCQDPSNARSEGHLDAFLKEHNITGICEIDTRELTRILRKAGTMNAMITTDLREADLQRIRTYHIENALASVATKKIYHCHESGNYTVVLMDFGCKENIKRELIKRNCHVIVVPHTTCAKDIYAYHPDGIVLSNGPGNPMENIEVIATLKELMTKDIPIFGICLGHQLLALAHGFSSEKLAFGHRGANQSVRDLETGNIYMTSQNHGYAIRNDSIDTRIAKPWFINVNDGTNEGIRYHNVPFFSVQFHPEGCSGPQDTNLLFDMFLKEVSDYATRSSN